MPGKSPGRTLGLGIVGLGMAGGVMASCVDGHPRVRLVAAADPNAELRARFERDRNVTAFDDIDGLLACPAVEAVYIATPHAVHRDHAVAAAMAGKHVVVEKPMALSLAECDDMIATAKAHDVVLIVGHTHGFDPAIRLMRRLIEEGRVGRPAMIAQWNYTDFLYRPRRAEELDTARGGGILYNQVPHQVDIARLLAAQPVESVKAAAAILDERRATEGACAALLEFTDGAAASIVYSGYDYFDSDETHGWITEGGYVKKPGHGLKRRAIRTMDEQAEREARWRDFGYGKLSTGQPPYQPHFGELIVTCTGGDMRPGADSLLIYTADGVESVPIEDSGWRPGRGDVLEELMQTVEGAAAAHDGEFGRSTLAACLAIVKSARERREVKLTEIDGCRSSGHG